MFQKLSVKQLIIMTVNFLSPIREKNIIIVHLHIMMRLILVDGVQLSTMNPKVLEDANQVVLNVNSN